MSCCCSFFSRSVVSDSLWPHGWHATGFSVPHHLSRVCSNSCPLSQWCHPTISSSVAPFSSRPQSFPASGSFPVSQLFISGSQSIRASASVLPVISFRIDWFDLPDVQGTFKRLLQHHNSKASILWCSVFFMVQLSHPNMIINFMAAITICSDFGAQENKICHSFHLFPLYLLWGDGTKCCDLSITT